MRFAEFQMIHWLWALILLGVFLFWAYQRKQKFFERFCERGLLGELAASYHSPKEIIKGFLIVFVFIFSVLALMRPQWGFQWQEVKLQGLDIIVAMDTSKSMLADDVKPSRLERSKWAVRDLLKKLSGDRIGLVAFAGSGFMVCPLTVDYGGFLMSLDDLNTDIIPVGGTNVGSAIQTAIKGYENVPGKYRAVIIVTDGENLEGDPMAAAKEAKVKGIRIFCVGIGTQEGELIRIPNNEGQYEFLKDKDGNFVKSRLNEDLLQKIALATDGIYVRASGAEFGFDVIYERLAGMEKREIKSAMEKKFHERFQYPLAAAVILLICETVITTRKKE